MIACRSGTSGGNDILDIHDIQDIGGGDLVCLFGIESPGLTSSLALGEEVAQRMVVRG